MTTPRHATPACSRGSVDTGWRTACSRYSGVYFLRLPDTGTSFAQDQRSHDQASTIRGQPQMGLDPACWPRGQAAFAG
jgi:hypothetical protein